MTDTASSSASSAAPKVGFVSLGCPKALTDSELILTRLSAEGYQTSKTFEGADLVIVNTCGFIDEAVKESLDTIGEALAENGRVIVTGCLGARADDQGSNLVQSVHPRVLAVTGPHATDEVMQAVHTHLPKPHDPFVDLVPQALGPAGIKLTPKHYAYLKISEGCNHRCTFCIIPSMRGDLVSRPIGQVLDEARALFESGVRELLVVSQDTSAYGVDLRYRTGFWDGKPIKTRTVELVQALGELAHPYGAWVRLHYVYPYPSVDEIIPLMAEGWVLPYLDVPFQHSHPDVLQRMKRPASGWRVGANSAQSWWCAAPSLPAFPGRPKPSSNIC
jgi:ribosomal protein S12 methylthiotransferase